MSIPSFEAFLKPALQIYAKNKNEIRPRDIQDEISKVFNFTDEEKKEMLPSKTETVLKNRIQWAVYYLFRAGLVERTNRGYYKITDLGIKESNTDDEINVNYLKKFPSFIEFSNNKSENIKSNDIKKEENQTPDEMILNAQTVYLENLQNELLTKLKQVDPIKFEEIVLFLMEKMNYGVGEKTKISHDGGIDGIINEDELGLEKIYLQAKRYSDNKVNEKEMQNFAGALGCSNVRKGVFITTSYFDDKAKKKALSIQGKVIRLIDGKELTALMIKHNVGVQLKEKVEIKKIDEDFFSEE
ncbi:MAG: restriction endonuclease [Elusimicrobia bacterium]|nr:restriction endonuclease [Elusimicrobiota bacterium]